MKTRAGLIMEYKSFQKQKFQQSGSGLYNTYPDPNPCDPKRSDPTGSGSATLVFMPHLSNNLE